MGTDKAYGTGPFTLSAFAAEGINTTFCGGCYLGICSAGDAGGDGSAERRYIEEHILRTAPQDDLARREPRALAWSHGSHVDSPLVYGKSDKTKQDAVEDIRQWYQAQSINIEPENVYFFGDRTENIEPFAQKGFNARDIDRYDGSEIIGFCGARPEEVPNRKGITMCSD